MKKKIKLLILIVLILNLIISFSIAEITTDNMADNNAVKIICYGDSVTYGDNGHGRSLSPYPQELQKILRSVYSNDKIEVVNKGVNGMQSDEALLNFEQSVLYENPNVVVIMFGINDASNVITPKNTIEQYKSNLVKMVEQAQQNNIDVILLTSTPTFSKHYGIDGNKRIYRYSRAVEYIAIKYKAKYIDMYTSINKLYHSKQYTNYDLQGFDYVHFTDKGYKILAETIARYGFNINEYILNVSDNITVPIASSPFIESDFIAINEDLNIRCHRNYLVFKDNSVGSYLNFEFYNEKPNNKLYLISPKSYLGGKLKIYDNGEYISTIDFYSPNILYDQKILISENVKIGYHKFEFKTSNLDQSNGIYSNCVMYFSEFEFLYTNEAN